jgi:hypothetical protein
MGVLDGQAVAAAITNPAFINKNISDQMPNQLDFTSATSGFGASVINIQRAVNALFSFVGENPAAAFNATPPWATSNRGISTDSVFVRVEAIDTAFSPVTGHKHTGTAGDAPQLDASGSITGNIVRTLNGLIDNVSVTGSGGISVSVTGQSIVISGGSGYQVYGTRGNPELITAVGGITAHADQRQLHFIAGSGGAITITANPSISPGTIIGQELLLCGATGSNSVQINDGSGVNQNGQIIIDADEAIGYVWSGTGSGWFETFRRM